MKTVQKRWLDLGELGQHEVEIVAHICTDFPYIESAEVTAKGEVIQLVYLIKPSLEQEILNELEIDYSAYQHEMAEDRKLDEFMAREAA